LSLSTLIKQRGFNLVASRQARSAGWFLTVTARQQSPFVPGWRHFLALPRAAQLCAASAEGRLRFEPRWKV